MFRGQETRIIFPGFGRRLGAVLDFPRESLGNFLGRRCIFGHLHVIGHSILSLLKTELVHVDCCRLFLRRALLAVDFRFGRFS